MKQAKYNDSTLSEAIGKNRTWLHDIRNRKPPAISEFDANLLAEKLNCTIQDIGVDGKNEAWNPVVIDHVAAVNGRLEKLLPKDAALIDDLLKYLEFASHEQKDALLEYVNRSPSMAYPEPIPDNTQWWKVVYISVLCDKLIQQLDVCSSDDLLDRYRKQRKSKKFSQKILEEFANEAAQQGNPHKHYADAFHYSDIMKGILHRSIGKQLIGKMDDMEFIRSVTSAVSEVICEIMNTSIQEAIGDEPSDILNEVCNICANFFVIEFENLSPEHKIRIRQLKGAAQRER